MSATSPDRRRRPALVMVAAIVLLLGALGAWWYWQTPLRSERWLLQLPHTRFGSLEVLATFEWRRGGRLRVASAGAALAALRRLPGAQGTRVRLEAGSFVFDLNCASDDTCAGSSVASRAGDAINLAITTSQQLNGEIGSGWFQGPLNGRPLAAGESLPRDYPGLVEALDRTVQAQLFDPTLVAHPDYQTWLAGLRAVAAVARDDIDLVLARQWAVLPDLPFSHLELKRATVSAEAQARRFDQMDWPGTPVTLTFAGAIAQLRIAAFIGRNTETDLRQALQQIVAQDAAGLVVDLRGNPGGAFAIVPLLECLLAEPTLVGVFRTQRGYREAGGALPDPAQLAGLPAWQERSLLAWWQALATGTLLKVVIEPAATGYRGPVVVLVDGATESAAELVAQVLQVTGRARIVGAQTPGRLLSAAWFDLRDGWQLGLPVADYFAQGRLRVEGKGVTPDVVVAAEVALERALTELAAAAPP